VKEVNTYRIIRMSVFLFVALLHVGLLAWFRFNVIVKQQEAAAQAEIMKLVDVEEYIPPPPPPPPPPPRPKKKIIETAVQPVASEMIIEVEEQVVETAEVIEPPVIVPREPEYLPQHKISEIPVIPSKEILKRIEYPPLALKQKLQAVVYVELFIDSKGAIRRINVLKDPGNGFAEAAVKAISGLTCEPAKANGKPVAVRFRYPIRFALK